MVQVTDYGPKVEKPLPKQFIDFNKIGNLFTHTLKRIKILNNCQNLIIASSRDYEYLIKRNLKTFAEDPYLILEGNL